MPFKILYHEDALDDLEEIFDWSLDKHPESTSRFATEFFNHLDLAAAFPYIGLTVRSQSNVRRLIHSPLIIYYRVDELRESIEILHVRHSSRRGRWIH